MRTVDLVVLDLAGTTVEERGQVPEAFASALRHYGVHVDADEIKQVRGASKRDAIHSILGRRGLSREVCDEAFQRFRQELERRYVATARPMPGAVQTMAWLRAHGMAVALNTGFDRATTTQLIAALGWTSGVADVVVCGEDVEEGRPSPALIQRCMQLSGVHDAQRVANVGDTVLDLQAGHRARVRFNIGVLTGAHSRETLAREPHTAIVESVADLPSVLWEESET
jgi:phosphonatase-like hydrolase